MKLPEPVAWMLDGGVTIEMQFEPYHMCQEWEPLYTEDQLREALAQQEAVMRQALGAIADLAGYRTDVDKAIKALQEALI